MNDFDPFKPAYSSIDPSMFVSSSSMSAMPSELDKLMSYMKSEGVTPGVGEAAAEATKGVAGAAIGAGGAMLGTLGKEIAASQQLKAAQMGKIKGQEGIMRGRAASQESSGKFKSIADLIANYRAATG